MKYLSLNLHESENSVLYFDSEASNSDLLACATQRFRAARDLLSGLTCVATTNTDARDLLAVTEATAILLQDGCSVLTEMERRGWSEGRTA
ncbi:hypothetical protein [Pseudomonas fluorescens]|uniref:DUF3077 domain-containing protein n=1 Tax=Pseudomonas fluorescens TaxID=294 RepID=A0A5E6ZIY5_PSEFL|nr:hypothetical protein [Pseudomonas fluorescens]VVN66278.1 hypothetical protein PS723_00115 [Pseudomonas fluorescens]